MCASVRAFTILNLNISKPIGTKFHLKHYLGGGGFRPDWIRTLVSVATDSSHRVIMGKRRYHVSLVVFYWKVFILTDNDAIDKSLYEFEIRPDRITDYIVRFP